MDLKKINVSKVCAVLSGGVLLVVGIQNIRYSEVKKLSKKIGNLKFNDGFSGQPVLDGIHSELVYQINDAPNICRKFVNDEYNYKVRSYIPTLSSDFVIYTFYDDYIEIDLLNENQIYSKCFYNNDGSYSISCKCDNNDLLDDRMYTINYNFSSDGVLSSYISYDGFFENTNDDSNSYSFTKKK